MKRCGECRLEYMGWTQFGRHMVRLHGVNSEAFWRRANQVGDRPCVAVRTEGGRWLLMVQEGLGL